MKSKLWGYIITLLILLGLNVIEFYLKSDSYSEGTEFVAVLTFYYISFLLGKLVSFFKLPFCDYFELVLVSLVFIVFLINKKYFSETYCFDICLTYILFLIFQFYILFKKLRSK